MAQAGQVARLAQQRQLRTVGNGAAHGHEQRSRQRDQLQHQHADHHLQRVARQAIADGRDDHDAREHQADQRCQHGKTQQHRGGVQIQVACQSAPGDLAVTGRRQHQHTHHGTQVQDAPPGQRPAPHHAPGEFGQGKAGQARNHGWIIAAHRATPRFRRGSMTSNVFGLQRLPIKRCQLSKQKHTKHFETCAWRAACPGCWQSCRHASHHTWRLPAAGPGAMGALL